MSSDVGEEIVYLYCYKIVRSFTQYKEYIENFHNSQDDTLTHICASPSTPFLQYSKDEDFNICPVAMRYLDYVKKLHHDHLIDKACKFFYYWLYNIYFDEKKSSEDTFKLYSALLDIANPYYDDIYENHKIKINENILKKLKDLDDMHENLNSIKNKKAKDDNFCKCANDCANIYMTYQETCSESKEINFCHELEIIRGRYKNLVNTIENCNAKKWLPSYIGFNPVISVLIPLVGILLISFSLFILYKFTPMYTWIRPQKRKMNKLGNSMYDSTNPSSYAQEINNNFYNRKYHISYG
ncbi:PIR protein [Plasmodium vivax]|uniref:VIR protein n=1 Tax=Plasmodium vivax TaxID=5855 RepID=A0A565A4D3_PLAVI|nr:PIR protein [Plasmodium vivax]